MPLTPEEMKQLIVQLEDLCNEARRLQDNIRQAMADRAARDRPVRTGGRQERRRKTRATPDT